MARPWWSRCRAFSTWHKSVNLTLVIDIGKSHAKLLFVDPAGEVLERHVRGNASVPSPLGYPALDVLGLQLWMAGTVRGSKHAAHCQRVIASTHGAAFVALAEDGVAWQPLDYEFDCLGSDAALSNAYQQARDPFERTLSPDLPAGLNAARQLYWMQQHHPEAWARTGCLLPYPQYWAWVLRGVAASERSSLGCHTQLWCPQQDGFSKLAEAQGWDRLFAPLRSAWEVLGPVQPNIAADWGLPANCQVHVGVHDSNACLVRYLRFFDAANLQNQALTLVSSGTWTVLMAPGAPVANLDAASDMLGNVDVLGRCTPTARFMGGRDYAALLDGADNNAGTMADVERLIARENFASPGFSWLEYSSKPLPASERAALAALYCAQMTSGLVGRLWQGAGLTAGAGRVVVEGPLAHNALYMAVLQSLLPHHTCQASTDTLEGTARGAWLLAFVEKINLSQ